MSVEEMATEMANVVFANSYMAFPQDECAKEKWLACKSAIKYWLNSEVEE